MELAHRFAKWHLLEISKPRFFRLGLAFYNLIYTRVQMETQRVTKILNSASSEKYAPDYGKEYGRGIFCRHRDYALHRPSQIPRELGDSTHTPTHTRPRRAGCNNILHPQSYQQESLVGTPSTRIEQLNQVSIF